MSLLTRHIDDSARPTAREALRDLFVRAIGPAAVLFGLLVALGFALKGPLDAAAKREEEVNRELAAERTGTWDTITAVWSHIGNTEYVIGVAVLVALLVWWRTKQWWYAVLPVLAISLQATVFVLTTWITDRQRPQVSKLDPAPPTSSFPSGHVGASTALYLTFALMAQRIQTRWVRWVVTAGCLLMPLLVTYARLYRGMHHVIDVSAGLLNGALCALLAWYWLRRRSRD